MSSRARVLRKDVAHDGTKVFGADQNGRSHRRWAQNWEGYESHCFAGCQQILTIHGQRNCLEKRKRMSPLYILAKVQGHKGILGLNLSLETDLRHIYTPNNQFTPLK